MWSILQLTSITQKMRPSNFEFAVYKNYMLNRTLFIKYPASHILLQQQEIDQTTGNDEVKDSTSHMEKCKFHLYLLTPGISAINLTYKHELIKWERGKKEGFVCKMSSGSNKMLIINNLFFQRMKDFLYSVWDQRNMGKFSYK